MRAFLQSLDERVWQAMEISWTKPKEAPADWNDAKIKAANFNSRALNALFSVSVCVCVSVWYSFSLDLDPSSSREFACFTVHSFVASLFWVHYSVPCS